MYEARFGLPNLHHLKLNKSMKPKTSIATLAAVLALAGPAFSQAPPADWGSTGAVTVALTLSYGGDLFRLQVVYRVGALAFALAEFVFQ